MIRRNVASQPILIGPLNAIADGAAQTSGAAIAVRKDGTDVGAAGGTLSHVDSGVWQYIPTQGETDCALLGLILTKADCVSVPLNATTTLIPVQTVAGSNGGLPTVDANNRVAGIAGTKNTLDDLNDFDAANDAVANVTLVDTTTTNTDMRGTDNALLASSAPTNFADLAITETTGRVTVGTNADKAGYALVSTGLDAVTAWTVDITGSLSGSVGSVTGAVGSVTGGVTVTTNNDKTGYSLATAPPTSAAIADAVLDEAVSGHLTGGTLGAVVNAIPTSVWNLILGGGQSAADTLEGRASAAATSQILSHLGSWTGTGVNTILGAFKALLSKSASTPSDIGGTFAASTDSTEAIRDRIDDLSVVKIEGIIDNSLGDATNDTFRTNVTDHPTGSLDDQLLMIVTGDLIHQTKPISSYTATNGVFVLSEPLTGIPANGVRFQVISDHVHPVSQIQDGLILKGETLRYTQVASDEGNLTADVTIEDVP